MGAKKAPKGGNAPDILQQKSPAEFFADNKNIAGFDNPGKCLYTSVRELVENALDAAESVSQLPDIDITIEEISQSTLNTMRGVTNHARRDAELYHDFESAAARAKREAKQAKEIERAAKAAVKKGESAAAAEARVKEAAAKAAAKEARDKVYFRVTVRDNGAGMAHDDIPDMLGRVLSGTKYGVKQTRGKFGLGAKMVLIWSKMSTGLPIEVTSARRGSTTKSYYKLDIDIQRNEPNVHVVRKLDNPERWSGSELCVIIAGNWQYYRSKVLKYLQQIAVITPYAQFHFIYRPETAAAATAMVGGEAAAAASSPSAIDVTFARRTDVMPPPPRATKHHPSSVDLELIKRLAAATAAPALVDFLSSEFACVSPELASRIVSEMRSGAHEDDDPTELDARQLLRLHQLLHEVKFPDPDGAHLSPAGEYNLRLGVMKELRPELVATHAGPVGVADGHAFVVEAAVSVGGRDVKPGINVYRFANRIPLLFEGGSDVITRTATKRINWASYKINQNTDRVGVFVSLVSTKIPFKGAGKEYMADDVEEIQAAVKSAIQSCALQLRQKIARAAAAREQRQRKRNLAKYIPNVAAAVHTVLKTMADDRDPERAARRRRLEATAASMASTAPPLGGLGGGTGPILARVARGEVTEDVLAKKLAEHVERIDSTMALEYQTQQGVTEGARVDAYLVPQGPRHSYKDELHSECAVIKMLEA